MPCVSAIASRTPGIGRDAVHGNRPVVGERCEFHRHEPLLQCMCIAGPAIDDVAGIQNRGHLRPHILPRYSTVLMR